MGILTKKIKKINGVKKFFYFLTSLVYIVAMVYFIFGLLHLKGIETFLRIIVIVFVILWGLIYLFVGLISLLAKKTKLFIVLTILSLLMSPVFIVSSYYINKVYNSLSLMNKNTITYTTNLIALKDTNFNSSSKIGMIEAEDDIEGHQLAETLIHKKNMTNKVIQYEDYGSMIKSLYEGKIDACFVTSNYAITFGNENFTGDENEEPIAEKVKVIDEYSEDRDNQDTATIEADLGTKTKNKSITEPFTMLIMGVDSEDDGLKTNQAFNGDTLIMITFNPKTLTATMFSIPRDMYVPIACNNNRYAKINSSAAYGSSCVINTVKQLTGISVDYYLKMNFKGVVDLVDALGGVTVDVEEPDFTKNWGVDCGGQVCEQDSLRKVGSNMIYVPVGVNEINGEQALAYARCRHLYATSDIARNRHQQDIIEAIAKKAKTIRSVGEFEDILDAVSRNLETNMTPEQILSFYNVFKDVVLNSNSESLSIKKTYLAYYNLTVWRGYNASALGYYQGSLDAITKLMRQNLGLEEVKPITTFSISYNEDYKAKLTGYGITTGTKLETLPNFEGYDKNYVSNWCSERGLKCNFEKRASDAEFGEILEQSEYMNSLLKALGTVTFYYSDASLKPKPQPTTPQPSTGGNGTGTGNGNQTGTGNSNQTGTGNSNQTGTGNSNQTGNSGNTGNTGNTGTGGNTQPETPTTPQQPSDNGTQDGTGDTIPGNPTE